MKTIYYMSMQTEGLGVGSKFSFFLSEINNLNWTTRTNFTKQNKSIGRGTVWNPWESTDPQFEKSCSGGLAAQHLRASSVDSLNWCFFCLFVCFKSRIQKPHSLPLSRSPFQSLTLGARLAGSLGSNL